MENIIERLIGDDSPTPTSNWTRIVNVILFPNLFLVIIGILKNTSIFQKCSVHKQQYHVIFDEPYAAQFSSF